MYFKSLFKSFFLISLLSSNIHAETTEPWKLHPINKCEREFLKFTEAENFNKDTYREYPGSFNTTVYRNFSKMIGEWTEVHMVEKSSPVVYAIKDQVITKTIFDDKCKFVSTPQEWPWEMQKALTVKTNEDWGNTELAAQISSGKPGMIYYWSPKFTYSVYDMPRVEKLAKKLGYEFIAVVDPRASQSEVDGAMKVLNKSLKNKADRKLASSKTYSRNISTDLYMRAGFNHFPVTYIYNNKKIHPRWITGIMTDEGIHSMAGTFAGELK